MLRPAPNYELLLWTRAVSPYKLLSSHHILFASLVLHDVYFICAVSLCCNALHPLLLLTLQLHCYVSNLKRTLCPQQQVSNCHISCSTVVHTLYSSSCEGLKPDSCRKHHVAQKKNRESSLLNPAKKSISKNVFAGDLTCTCTDGCSIIIFEMIYKICWWTRARVAHVVQ